MAGGRLQCNVNYFEPVAGSILVQARSAVQYICVQRVRYAPVVYIAGTVLSFLDSLTGQSIGTIIVVPPSAGPNANQYGLEFDSDGFPLSNGANLLLSVVSGGVSGTLEVDAFQLPLYVVAPYVAPHTAGVTA